ncbi:MAG: hypothetical protein IJB83_02645 [Bacilli bacterium]|nr:hypothetical protein [Bacilli bacterium]
MTDKQLKKKSKVEEYRNEIDEAKEKAMYKFYEKRRLREVIKNEFDSKARKIYTKYRKWNESKASV